jgi:probable F420-dependent oxidoreductase
MPSASTSTYPFSAEGRMTWDPAEPWYEAIVTMATAAAVTHKVEIGAAVLIAPVRNPIVLAKQVATIDVLSGGRVALGVGVGWLAEEFEALGAPFESRGRRLDDWIDIMRDCWTGTPGAWDTDQYHLPEGMICEPRPAHRVPIVIGGLSKAAFRRVARRGDGWLGFMTADAVNPEQVTAARRGIEEAGGAASARIMVRIPGDPVRLAPHVASLQRVGVDDVIVNVPWNEDDGPERTVEMLRSGLS